MSGSSPTAAALQNHPSVHMKTVRENWKVALKNRRTEMELTPADLAQMIREKPSTIPKYEDGDEIPNAEFIQKLEKALVLKIRGWEPEVTKKKVPTAATPTARSNVVAVASSSTPRRAEKMSDVAADTRQLINPSQEGKRFDPDLLKVKAAEFKKLPHQQKRDWFIAHLILKNHAVLFDDEDEDHEKIYGTYTDDDFKVEYYEEEEEEDESKKNDDGGCLLDQKN